MRWKRSTGQHVAVFGESGSGKTVLLSSFYGATQEPQFSRQSLFHVVADDIGQGNQLYRNYLGMRDSARPPDPTRFRPTSYGFSVKVEHGTDEPSGSRRFDALHLVWHDYPGEWFEQGVSGPDEARRRVETFRALLQSDVALLLVDGQRLLDNAGEEERYLKSLLGNLRNGLRSLEDEVREDGKPFIQFPRIWMLALSKADLLPELDVYQFRDLLIGKVADEIEALRQVLAGFVASNDALAVGEDFILLSSAKFEPDRIEVNERVGLNLVLPLASMLPLERHLRWFEQKKAVGAVAEQFLGGAGPLAATMLGNVGGRVLKVGAKVSRMLGFIDLDVIGSVTSTVTQLAGDSLKKRNAEARAKQDNIVAVLTGFLMDLEAGEADRVLLRSRR